MGDKMANIVISMFDKKGNEKQITRVFHQDVIPRKGEILWLHSYIHDDGESEINCKRILKEYGTTRFKVIEVCHWISRGTSLRDCAIYLKVKPLTDL